MAELPWNELRCAREFSQKMRSEALNIQQFAKAKMEQRPDRCIRSISTLRNHLEVMGAKLEIEPNFLRELSSLLILHIVRKQIGSHKLATPRLKPKTFIM